LAYDLIKNAEKVITPLATAAIIVFAAGRLKNEPAIIAIPAATALKGSQLVIAFDILSFICNQTSTYNMEIQNKNFSRSIKKLDAAYLAITYCTSALWICVESLSLKQLSHLQRTGSLHPSHNSTISSSDPQALQSVSGILQHLLG
jgi:hypothetical protein